MSKIETTTSPPRDAEPAGTGLRETFMKRYTVKRANKAEIRPKEQSENVKSCWENV